MRNVLLAAAGLVALSTDVNAIDVSGLGFKHQPPNSVLVKTVFYDEDTCTVTYSKTGPAGPFLRRRIDRTHIEARANGSLPSPKEWQKKFSACTKMTPGWQLWSKLA